jgi:quercetin dioxygenase-like cupin family protein
MKPTLSRWDALELDKVTEMIARKIIPGGSETLAQAYFKKGALVPWHAHEGDQMIYVLQGALRALVNGQEITVREGEVLHVPPQMPHQAEALDDTFVIDVKCTRSRATADRPSRTDESRG